MFIFTVTEPNKMFLLIVFLNLWGRICFTSPCKFFEEMAFLVKADSDNFYPNWSCLIVQ